MNVQAGTRRAALVAAVVAAGVFAWAGVDGSSIANAAVVYSDDFSGDNTDLTGAAPDAAPGGETWTAGANFNRDGTVTGVGTAYLPFVPQSGQVYTATLNVSVTPATDNFIGLGFTRLQGSLGARFFAPASGIDPQAVFWLMSRGTDGSPAADQSFIGPSTGGGVNASVNSADTIAVEIDTTGATWTVRWAFNGVFERTVTGITPDPAISYVAITSSNTSGTIDNFSLTAVPEPATFSAALLAGGLLCGRRRGRLM